MVASWEVVATAALDFAIGLGAQPPFAIWGRSLGGYLSLRSCAGDNRFAVCVADGGLLDMFQNVVCQMPSMLTDLLYT
jgi:hypothetical protein